MKKTVCLNCGEIYVLTNDCSYCGFSNLQFQDILNGSKGIFTYGYSYRVYYEKQLESKGKIDSKPSLFVPETIPELLTVFALGGIIGSFSYNVFTMLAKKLISLIREEKIEDKYSEIIKLITNDDELKSFFNYVSDYYWQRPTLDETVKSSINEEVMADFISNSICKSGYSKTFEMKDKDEASKLRLEIIKQAYKEFQDNKKNNSQIEVERLKDLFKEIKTTPNKSNRCAST